jgi:hypothetical protein
MSNKDNINENVKEWNEEDVQIWFKNGKFKDYAGKFILYDGKSLLKLSEKQCKDILKDDSIGILLFNTIQDLEKGKLKNVSITKVFFYL